MNNKLELLKKRLYLLALCGTFMFSTSSVKAISKDAKNIEVESNDPKDEMSSKSIDEVIKTINLKSANKPKTSYNYKNVDLSKFSSKSIIDLLTSIKLPSNVKFRAKLAVSYDVVTKESAYKGTYKQNILLTKRIKSKGIQLVTDKEGNIVGCKNPSKKDIIYTTNNKTKEEKTSQIKHNHKLVNTGKYKSNNDGTHVEILKCSCGKTKYSKKQKCNKKIKLENGNIIVYCDKCGYEFSKILIHHHDYTEYIGSTYSEDEKHLSTYRCPKDGKTITKEEDCNKVTKKEDGYLITYCDKCNHIFEKELDIIPSTPTITPPTPTYDYTEYVGSIYSENGKHLSTYRCPQNGKTITKEEDCNKVTKKENGYLINYCNKCEYEFSKIHEDHNYEKTGEFISNNDETHSEILKCTECDATQIDTELIPCHEDLGTLNEDETLKIYRCPDCGYEIRSEHNHQATSEVKIGCKVYGKCSCGKQLELIREEHKYVEVLPGVEMCENCNAYKEVDTISLKTSWIKLYRQALINKMHYLNNHTYDEVMKRTLTFKK